MTDPVPGRGLTLGPGSSVLALDVGGTTMKSAVVDQTGQLSTVSRTRTPSGAETPELILRHLESLIDAAREHGTAVPDAVGLSVPGIVDESRGVAHFASNLEWQDYPFRDRAEERLGLPVAFCHDVRAAGLAEVRLGGYPSGATIAVIVIGTGIASAIVVDGTPLVSGGYAGELGHSIIDAAGEPCACGGRGHLETVASAAAITRHYSERSGQAVRSAKAVLERSLTGDQLAQQVWAEAVEWLALGIVQLSSIVAPEIVVLGGGLAEARDQLAVPVRDRVQELLSFQRSPRIELARIGEDAGVIGTALAARDRMEGAQR